MLMNSNDTYVEALRLLELHIATDWLRPPLAILEVGAGAGWQARALSQAGHQVKAVDIPDSQFAMARVWPILDYDGEHLPFGDSTFDVVFSSNVLEHVVSLDRLLTDMCRVLKDGGYMIHVVPSASWRVWTSMTYYPDLIRRVVRAVFKKSSHGSKGAMVDANAKCETEKLEETPMHGRDIAKRLMAPAHGEAGSALRELVTFRRRHWGRVLDNPQLEFVEQQPIGLYYSGSVILGARLSFRSRRILAKVLGSSCHVFVMRKSSERSRA